MKKSLFLFGVLEHQDITWLIEEGELFILPANEHLIEKRVETEYVYIVLEGSLNVYDYDVDNTPLAKIGQGEILGELSFIDNLPPSATVTANVKTELVRIKKKEITKKLQSDKSFAARFYYSLSLLLSHRLRNQNIRDNSANELGEFLMDNIHQAGSYFRQMADEVRMKASD